jgi:predicted site-specific integrase-resolvase
MLETEETLIDTKGVARLAVVSPRTVQKWVAQRKIPVIRISPGCVRFSKRAVVAALAKLTIEEVA